MTDNEIRKALERCPQHTECCYCNSLDECGNKRTLTTSVLALINRQKTEIERLENENNDKERAYTDEFLLRKEWQRRCRELLEEKQNAKSEAIREFAERLKIRIRKDIDEQGMLPSHTLKKYMRVMIFVDNLVKEMMDNNFKE